MCFRFYFFLLYLLLKEVLQDLLQKLFLEFLIFDFFLIISLSQYAQLIFFCLFLLSVLHWVEQKCLKLFFLLAIVSYLAVSKKIPTSHNIVDMSCKGKSDE